MRACVPAKECVLLFAGRESEQPFHNIKMSNSGAVKSWSDEADTCTFLVASQEVGK